MKDSNRKCRSWGGLACGFAVLTAVVATGCQVDINGQTLPSPSYQTDDIQYFPTGPEFKLSREAAAMQSASPEAPPAAPPSP